MPIFSQEIVTGYDNYNVEFARIQLQKKEYNVSNVNQIGNIYAVCKPGMSGFGITLILQWTYITNKPFNFDHVELVLDGNKMSYGICDSIPEQHSDFMLEVGFMNASSDLVLVIQKSNAISYTLSGPDGKISSDFTLNQISYLKALLCYWTSSH
jgi:hypothetical protein